MHFELGSDLSDIDLWNIDLLDTHLGLLDTDIRSKHFVCLQDVFKTSSRYVFKTSSRRLQRNNFSSSKTSSRRLARCLQDVLEDEKLLRWRRVEDVFKTCLEEVLKTSSRPTNVSWVTNKLLHRSFSRILSKWTPSNGYFSFLHKMLEKRQWNSFLLYLWWLKFFNLYMKWAVSQRCSMKWKRCFEKLLKIHR